MGDHKPGDIVDITIDSARVEWVGVEGRDEDTTPVMQVLISAAGCLYYLTLPTGWPTINIAPVPPKPEHGEVWADQDGLLWVAQRVNDEEPVLMYSALGEHSPKQLAELYGPIRRMQVEEATDVR